MTAKLLKSVYPMITDDSIGRERGKGIAKSTILIETKCEIFIIIIKNEGAGRIFVMGIA